MWYFAVPGQRLPAGRMLPMMLLGEPILLARTRNGQVFALRHENQDLIEQSHRLEQDAATIEDEARRSLGMLDPGEVVFVLRDATTAAPPAACARSRSTAM